MKKYKIKGLLTLVISIYVSNVNGQFISAGTYTESNYGASVNSLNTGSDILDYNGNLYRVSVWSDNSGSAGIGWLVNTSTTGATAFNGTPNIDHADVALVVDAISSTVCAVVAMYTQGGGGSWYIEVYEWDGSSQFTYIAATALQAGSFGTTINVDADDINDFVVVFDDNDQSIYAYTGTFITGAGVVTMGNGGSGVSIAGGIFPDACIYDDGGSETVHVTYIDGFGDLVLNDHDFSTLFSGSPSSSNIITTSPPHSTNFSFCRIACPASNTASASEWTIVVQEDDRSTYYIEGYNDNSGVTPIYYNTGAYVAFGNLTGVPNIQPCVAYDDQYPSDGIWIGWLMDNLGNTITGATADALYPVVLKCDNDALPAASDYWEVPNTLGSTDQVSAFSIAGHYTNNRIWMSYFNVNSSGDIHYKEASNATGGLRIIDDNPINRILTKKVNNLLGKMVNSNTIFTFTLFDLQGSLILTGRGTYEEVSYLFYKRIPNLSEALYVAQMISEDGTSNSTQKMFIVK